MKNGSSKKDTLQRTVLPIPDMKPIGFTTYDAKDPETKDTVFEMTHFC